MVDLSPERALIFRITHIDNVAFILKNGVHSRNSAIRDPSFREIGNPDLIHKRATRQIPVPPGGTLSDYVPMYFTPYSPMLLNIKTGHNGMKQTAMADVVVLVSSLHTIAERGLRFLFTPCHAYLQTAEFIDDLDRLNEIDWGILRGRNFSRDPNDPGKMERYQAEALIHGSLSVDSLVGIACYGEAQVQQLRSIATAEGVACKFAARPDWYF